MCNGELRHPHGRSYLGSLVIDCRRLAVNNEIGLSRPLSVQCYVLLPPWGLPISYELRTTCRLLPMVDGCRATESSMFAICCLLSAVAAAASNALASWRPQLSPSNAVRYRRPKRPSPSRAAGF
jgi:hypothetical protein